MAKRLWVIEASTIIPTIALLKFVSLGRSRVTYP